MSTDRLCFRRLLGRAVSLVLVVHLLSCTAPTHPTNQPTNIPTTQPTPRASQFAIRNLHQAAHYYNRYHALALRRRSGQTPDDLLGPSTGSGRRLKRLAEVCTTLEEAGMEDGSCRDVAALREELEARTDDRYIVAKLLGILGRA